MVASDAASAVAVGVPPPSAALPESPAATASIDAYLKSGESVRSLADVMMKVGIGVFVLVALAWAAGVLPGAVKLF
jgi:hypothetical protein